MINEFDNLIHLFIPLFFHLCVDSFNDDAFFRRRRFFLRVWVCNNKVMRATEKKLTANILTVDIK